MADLWSSLCVVHAQKIQYPPESPSSKVMTHQKITPPDVASQCLHPYHVLSSHGCYVISDAHRNCYFSEELILREQDRYHMHVSFIKLYCST